MLNPSVLSARSFLYRELQKRGAALGEVNGYVCAMRIGADPAAEDAQARSLALCDLTPLKRIGFKGWATAEWLIGQGVTLEDAPNRVYPQIDGARIARLSKGEFVVLGDLQGRSNLPDRLSAAWSINSANGCFRVPREDANAWLCVSGEKASAMFAKMCGIDLRPHRFANNQIAQTSLARMNAIIMRADRGKTLTFDIVFDLASAVYLWDAILDAMAELGGKPVGLEAIKALG